ncbi:hypothetical protein BD289DRAFT_431748 [Coniella lustricola]|uniref:Uncharacterized protein n=1 Tax=Coniella lustricola TaxID=2025994 RepID=A0A2T3AAG6_9PEZI|nr:hypothetical protein BD289DRAFT_431748 [Coniella lustricola]
MMSRPTSNPADAGSVAPQQQIETWEDVPAMALKNGDYVISRERDLVWGYIRGFNTQNQPNREAENAYLVVPLAELCYRSNTIPSKDSRSEPTTEWTAFWRKLHLPSDRVERESRLFRGSELIRCADTTRPPAEEVSQLISEHENADIDLLPLTDISAGHDLVRQMLDEQSRLEEQEGREDQRQQK